MWVADLVGISAVARRPTHLRRCQMMILRSPKRTDAFYHAFRVIEDCSPEHVLGYKLQRGFYTTGPLAHLSPPRCAELCSAEPSCTGFSREAARFSMLGLIVEV